VDWLLDPIKNLESNFKVMDEETLKAKGLEDSSLASNLGILFVGIAMMILIVLGIYLIAKLAKKSKPV